MASTARASKSRVCNAILRAKWRQSSRRARIIIFWKLRGARNFEGSGVYYAATAREGQLLHGSTVIVAGGGIRPDRPPMFLSEGAEKVLL